MIWVSFKGTKKGGRERESKGGEREKYDWRRTKIFAWRNNVTLDRTIKSGNVTTQDPLNFPHLESCPLHFLLKSQSWLHSSIQGRIRAIIRIIVGREREREKAFPFYCLIFSCQYRGGGGAIWDMEEKEVVGSPNITLWPTRWLLLSQESPGRIS